MSSTLASRLVEDTSTTPVKHQFESTFLSILAQTQYDTQNFSSTAIYSTSIYWFISCSFKMSNMTIHIDFRCKQDTEEKLRQSKILVHFLVMNVGEVINLYIRIWSYTRLLDHHSTPTPFRLSQCTYTMQFNSKQRNMKNIFEGVYCRNMCCTIF